MRRMLLSVFLAAVLLTGCGGREAPASPDEAPEAALTKQDVINMYTAASAVYDWFDLTTLPLDMEDARTEGGLTYYRVDAENLSLPIAAVPEPTDSTLSWTPEPVTIASLADLRAAAETYFSPELVDSLFPCPRTTTRTSTASSTPPTAAGAATSICWARPSRRSRWMRITGP